MGFLFEGYSPVTAAGIIILVTVLVVLNEITRRSRVMSVVFYCILPVVLFALTAYGVLSSPSSGTWFGMVKTCSALVGVIGFMIMRYTGVGRMKYACLFPWAILSINIIEAIAREFEVFSVYKIQATDSAGIVLWGGVWNILNACAGIILLLTVTGVMGIKIGASKSADLVWPDQLWFWIISYGIWNIAYCYNCISTRAMYAGVVLIVSCTFAEFFIKRGVWLQHRAQTLALFGMFSLAYDYHSLPLFGISATYSRNALITLSALSLVANVCVMIAEIYTVIKKRRNPFFNDLYTDTEAYRRNLVSNGLGA